MKTKFKLIIGILAIVCGLQSCTDDNDNLKLKEANSRVIVTSQMNFNNSVRIGNTITFGDLSSGVVSRLWNFPEGSADIVGSDNDITSSEQNVKALFNVAGTYDITLNQEFKGEAYDLLNPNLRGKVLDTTIVVTVFGEIESVLTANYINDDGSVGAELNMTDNAENEVTAGRSIQLTYESTGGPTRFVWNLEGGNPTQIINPNEPAKVKYSKLGTYDIQFIASNVRPAGVDTVNVKNVVKVIPSTEPVNLDRVFEKTSTIVGLEFSREMDPATINKNDFIVNYQTGSGATIMPSISSIALDPTEGNILLITLNEPYYNDDAVQVSYTPGTLSTADVVQATAFTNVLLTDIIKTNILDGSAYDYSFETSNDAKWQYLGWGGFTKYTSEISSAQAQDGTKSMYIEMEANDGMIMGHRDDAGQFIRFATKEKTLYEIGVWVYVTDLGNYTSGNPPDLRIYWNPGTDWGVGSNPALGGGFQTNKWVYASFRTSGFPEGNASFMIRGFNGTNPSPLKLYIDNITVAKLKIRP